MTTLWLAWANPSEPWFSVRTGIRFTANGEVEAGQVAVEMADAIWATPWFPQAWTMVWISEVSTADSEFAPKPFIVWRDQGMTKARAYMGPKGMIDEADLRARYNRHELPYTFGRNPVYIEAELRAIAKQNWLPPTARNNRHNRKKNRRAMEQARRKQRQRQN